MRKYIVILLLLLLFTVSCSEKNNTNYNLPESNANDLKDYNDKNDVNEVNIDLTQVNSDSVSYDREMIFFINNAKLYSVKKDGSKKTLIFDKEKINLIQIHDNKIYMLCFDYEKDIPSKLCTVNKDGSDFKILQLGLEFSSKYYVSHFVIYDNFLLYTVHDYNNTNEVDFPRDFYKYDLRSGNLTSVYEDLIGDGNPRICDNIYYYRVHGNEEYDILYKYNIDTDEKHTININKNTHKEKVITSNLNIQENYVYYSGKTYIDRDSIDGLSDTKTLLEDNSFMIITMSVTDKYIFFINREDNRTENPDKDTTKLSIFRMKLNGSEMEIIFNETMYCTNISPQSISIVTDDILIYRNRLTDTILAMDFNGNTLNWDL